MLSPDRGSGVGRSQSRYGEMIINGERMRWRWQVVQGLPFTPAWSPVSGRRHAAESRRIRAARTALPAGRDLEDLDLDLDRYPAARHACARLNPASKGQSAEQHPAGPQRLLVQHQPARWKRPAAPPPHSARPDPRMVTADGRHPRHDLGQQDHVRLDLRHAASANEASYSQVGSVSSPNG